MTEDKMDTADRRENAKNAAMLRTKIVNRKKLSDGKDKTEQTTANYTSRKSNMICFTGQEGNGL